MPSPAKSNRRGAALAGLAFCTLCGVFFVSSLGDLWPLPGVDLTIRDDRLVDSARAFFEARGFDLGDYSAARWTGVDAEALDYVETAFGSDRTRSWIADGLPLFEHHVAFKRRGEPETYAMVLHPTGGVLGWSVSVEDDQPGARLSIDDARSLATAAIAGNLGLDVAELAERAAASEERPRRTDHRFAFERTLSVAPELRERVAVTVAGDRVSSVRRSLVVPAAAERRARASEAPGVALETVGFALLALAALGAFSVFLAKLRQRSARLGRATFWASVVFACFTGASILDSAALFRAWDPLWPRAISTFRSLVANGIGQLWVLLVLLAVVAAGDALDRTKGEGRGASLWQLARGRWLDASVAAASRRGFSIGLVCGAVMAASVLVLQEVAGARTSIQPRGFFFYPLNSASPALTSLLFFWGVALTEELAYRYFGGTWLLALTGRRWIAITLPALVYGLTHTRLDFLPPAEPFWGRALVLTLVGCVWGWAFLRFDALTVVLSHYTADLFIFNWPRLASSDGRIVGVAVLTVAAPLLPALLRPIVRRLNRIRGTMRLKQPSR